MSNHTFDRSRVSLDVADWACVIELLKFRFDELVQTGQKSSGDIKLKHFRAAQDLWEIIKDMELQLPRHRRPDGACNTIMAPLRDWRASLKLLAPEELVKLPPVPDELVA